MGHALADLAIGVGGKPRAVEARGRLAAPHVGNALERQRDPRGLGIPGAIGQRAVEGRVPGRCERARLGCAAGALIGDGLSQVRAGALQQLLPLGEDGLDAGLLGLCLAHLDLGRLAVLGEFNPHLDGAVAEAPHLAHDLGVLGAGPLDALELGHRIGDAAARYEHLDQAGVGPAVEGVDAVAQDALGRVEVTDGPLERLLVLDQALLDDREAPAGAVVALGSHAHARADGVELGLELAHLALLRRNGRGVGHGLRGHADAHGEHRSGDERRQGASC